MAIEIASDITELLYSRDFIVIPGLGTFMGSYKPATIDHVQGILHPPSKSIRFKLDFNAKDDVLTNFLVSKYNCAHSEAQELVERFVTNAMKLLQKREMLIIPDVGRLYLDYENNHQFLQETNNFNIDAYGLPGIHYYPVLRSRKQLGYSVDPYHEQKVPFLQKIKRLSYLTQTVVPVAIALIAVLFAVSIYYNKTNIEDRGANVFPVSFKEVHVNKSPLGVNTLPEELIIEEEDDTDIVAEEEDFLDPEPEEVYAEGQNTDALTLPDDVKHCIIIIGQFSQKDGVRKRVEEIYELGYDVYTDKNKNLTRVGVQFVYESSSEIKKALRLVKKRFDESAFILKD